MGFLRIFFCFGDWATATAGRNGIARGPRAGLSLNQSVAEAMRLPQKALEQMDGWIGRREANIGFPGRTPKGVRPTGSKP